MIRHIVWWTLKEKAEGRTAEENAWRLEELSVMLRGMSSVRTLEVSSKIEPGTTVPAQFVLVSTHDDRDALKSYAADPVHLEFAAIVKAVAQERNAIDYETES